MLNSIASIMGFSSSDEFKKFSFLGVIFGVIIGTYWAMRPIKDSIFAAMVGIDYLPKAKMLSLCVVVPLVLLYGKLVDLLPRHKVFYLLAGVYGTIALALTYGFMHPVMGLANTHASSDRILGWVWYVYVESFGSLIVALFWAFVTDTTKPESATRGFPFIAWGGQLGNIFGPLFLNTKSLGLTNSGPIAGICGILIYVAGLLLWAFMYTTPKSELVGYHGHETKDSHEEPGLFEGLKLLLTRGYLFGIFMIITIFEIIVTVFDYHFKSTAKSYFPNEADFSAYLSSYAVWTGIVATVCILLKINNIQKYLGIAGSLVSLPILVSIAVCILKFNPTGLAIAFWIMVLSKAVNYALNQPTLKQLYIPTTKETKYKAQAWIEMFGSRGSKAIGSGINDMRPTFKAKYGSVDGIAVFLTMSSLLSGAMIIGWLFVALYVARSYNKAIKNNEVVC